MGRFSRKSSRRGTRESNYARSPADVTERARAAVEAHHARMSHGVAEPERLASDVEADDSSVKQALAAEIEAVVEDGVRRLHEEVEHLHASLREEIERNSAALADATDRQAEIAERLFDELSRLQRQRAAIQPASRHLAELQERIKQVAQIASANTAEEPNRAGSRSPAT
jgi:DNA repair exonuclease SbcCD ATPase subunit